MQEEQGRERRRRARVDKQWERAKREPDCKDNMPLSTVNSAGTHKPGVPHKASLAKSGHTQNMKETIAVSPATPTPAHKPGSGGTRAVFPGEDDNCSSSRWDFLQLLSTSKQSFPYSHLFKWFHFAKIHLISHQVRHQEGTSKRYSRRCRSDLFSSFPSCDGLYIT